MDRYEDILKAILVDGGQETLQSPATRAEIFQSALFTKSHLIDPVTSQLAAIADDVTELQNTGVDTVARAQLTTIGQTNFGYVLYPRTFKPTKGYYYKTGLALQYQWHNDDAVLTTEKIELSGAESVYLYHSLLVINASRVQFWDSSDAIIGDYSYGASGDIPSSYEITVPSGAEHVSYSSNTNSAGLSYIALSKHVKTIASDLSDIKNADRGSTTIDIKILESGKGFYRDGTLLASASYNLSDYVSCRFGDKFKVVSHGVGVTLFRRALYDENKNLLCFSEFGTGTSTVDTNEFTVDVYNAAFVRFSIYGTYIICERKGLNEESAGRTIIDYNLQALSDAVQLPRKNLTTSGVGKNVTLLHFSDIHGDELCLQNIQKVKDYLPWLDDAICTGDMLKANYTNDTMDFWDACDGKILTCIGNHEVLISGNTTYTVQPSETDIYAKFMHPYIATWGDSVSHTGTDLYYYKDYSDKALRLIVLNTMYPDPSDVSKQSSWLETVLAGAKTAGYSVVIAEHYYPNDAIRIDCTFSTKGKFPIGVMDTHYQNHINDYQQIVDTFITNGGKFICYLCGHKHTDYVAYTAGYSGQLFIGVGSALCPENVAYTEYDVGVDCARKSFTKSMDCFNLVAFDTTEKHVKIVRIGADRDWNMIHRGTLVLDYSTSPATVVHSD